MSSNSVALNPLPHRRRSALAAHLIFWACHIGVWVAVSFVVISLGGCAAETPKDKCYTGLDVATRAVDTTMDVAAEARRHDTLKTLCPKSDATCTSQSVWNNKIRPAYTKFQDAARTAFFGCKIVADWNDVPAVLSDVENAAAAIQQLVK